VIWAVLAIAVAFATVTAVGFLWVVGHAINRADRRETYWQNE